MGDYRIQCVVMDNPNVHRDHSRIAQVGIGSDRFTVAQVVTWIDGGVHTFFTTNHRGLYRRAVETCACGGTRRHIRSKPDERTDNNLEAQPNCP